MRRLRPALPPFPCQARVIRRSPTQPFLRGQIVLSLSASRSPRLFSAPSLRALRLCGNSPNVIHRRDAEMAQRIEVWTVAERILGLPRISWGGSLLLSLSLIPEIIHFDVIRVCRFAALFSKPIFDIAKPAAKFP